MKRICTFCGRRFKPTDGIVGIEMTITTPTGEPAKLIIANAHDTCAVVAMPKWPRRVGNDVA